MIVSSFTGLLALLAGVVLAIALPVAAVWVLFKLVWGLCWLLGGALTGIGKGIAAGARGVGFGFAHVGAFVRNTVVDSLRLVGALLTSLFVVPPVLGSVFLGRWSAANHYGRALSEELKEVWIRLYRVVLGNPVRLLGLGALTEGVERRLPEVVAQAPGPDRPRGGEARFPGYTVLGSLPRGGSGARLYTCEPTAEKRAELARSGRSCPDKVVVKAFSLEDGSTLPQIVRESRALSSARELGLVLDHSIEGESFWYVMPFVEGSDLAEVTRELHRRDGDRGLADAGLREVMTFAAQLLGTLDSFHGAGLWHKDIKPTNVIVGPDRRAHLVDFGLVTPLRSAMTLTTHGTEYFRDPEMVRLAMQGVRVHEVDGVKFDLYSIGAVLFSMVENSFPAHGSLSSITKRSPEALRWIVRRAMADTRNRYASARVMLADLATVLEARDPFALGPADLPSFAGDDGARRELDPKYLAGPIAASAAPLPGPAPEPAPATARRRRPVRHFVHRGVLVATLVFFGVLAAGAQHLAQRGRWKGVTGNPVVQVVSTPRRAGEPFAVRTAPSLAAASATAKTCYRHENHVHHAPDCPGHHTVPGDGPVAPAEPLHVLVVDDLSPQVGAGVLDSVLGALRAADLIPHGTAGDDPREIEWLAAARRAAGPGAPDDEGDRERLLAFVTEDELLDAVLWLSADSEGKPADGFFVGERGAPERIAAITRR